MHHSIELTKKGEAFAQRAELRPAGCPAGVEPHEWRKALSSRVEQHLSIVTTLLALLDDGVDPDLEPSILSPDDLEGDGIDFGDYQGEGCENFDDEDDGTREPSLAAAEAGVLHCQAMGFWKVQPYWMDSFDWQMWLKAHNDVQAYRVGDQTDWFAGGVADLEAVNEDGGNVTDEPHDGDLDLWEGDADEDKEPELGWSNPGWDGTMPEGWSYTLSGGDR